MNYVFKTITLENPDKVFTVTLPKHAIVFDVFKSHNDYGNSFKLCYRHDKEELAKENMVFHLFKEGDETEIVEKCNYIGKYNIKFSNGLVFVFRQVVP